MNKKGVYLHGLESTNTGGKIMWAKSTYNIYNPSLDYKYLNKANVTLDDFIKQYSHYDYFVGSSMGGFVAFYIATKLNKPVFLLNPSLVYDNNKHPFLPPTNIKYNNNMFVMFGKNDVVVKPNNTLNKLKLFNVKFNSVTLNTGHRFSLDEFKPYFNKWAKGV